MGCSCLSKPANHSLKNKKVLPSINQQNNHNRESASSRQTADSKQFLVKNQNQINSSSTVRNRKKPRIGHHFFFYKSRSKDSVHSPQSYHRNNNPTDLNPYSPNNFQVEFKGIITSFINFTNLPENHLQVPYIVYYSIKELEQTIRTQRSFRKRIEWVRKGAKQRHSNLSIEGLYRKNGNKNIYINSLNRLLSINFRCSPLRIQEEIRNLKDQPLNITSIIKYFFQKCLNEPLLTNKMLPFFILIIDPDIVNPPKNSDLNKQQTKNSNNFSADTTGFNGLGNKLKSKSFTRFDYRSRALDGFSECDSLGQLSSNFNNHTHYSFHSNSNQNQLLRRVHSNSSSPKTGNLHYRRSNSFNSKTVRPLKMNNYNEEDRIFLNNLNGHGDGPDSDLQKEYNSDNDNLSTDCILSPKTTKVKKSSSLLQKNRVPPDSPSSFSYQLNDSDHNNNCLRASKNKSNSLVQKVNSTVSNTLKNKIIVKKASSRLINNNNINDNNNASNQPTAQQLHYINERKKYLKEFPPHVLQKLQDYISKLPLTNQHTLAFLMLHFQKVLSNHNNKMDLTSLSISVAPSIIGDLDPYLKELYTKQQEKIQFLYQSSLGRGNSNNSKISKEKLASLKYDVSLSECLKRACTCQSSLLKALLLLNPEFYLSLMPRNMDRIAALN